MPPADLAAQCAVLDRVGSLEREQAVLYARQARARAEMAALWGNDAGVLLELAGTARIGQGRAGGQLCRAERLVRHLPVALGLLEHGVMRVGTAEILLALTKSCTAQVQQLLDTQLSERICVMDAVDARRLIAATIPQVEADLDAEAQRERHERARANRGVWAFPVEDGMARIGAELDQLTARRWTLDFEELVRAQKVLDDRAGVTRTQAQRRADVFAALPSQVLALADAAARDQLLDLITQVRDNASGDDTHADVAGPASPAGAPEEGGYHHAPADEGAPGTQAGLLPGCLVERDRLLAQLLRLPVRNPRTLNVHVGMTTLLDLDQRSGWLEGFGPIPALHARMLLADARLRRVAVDARTGVPLGVDPLTGAKPPWDGEFDPPARRHRHRLDRTAAQARRALLLMIGTPAYLTDRAEPQHDPSAALREQMRLRDQCCDGPGCPRSASVASWTTRTTTPSADRRRRGTSSTAAPGATTPSTAAGPPSTTPTPPSPPGPAPPAAATNGSHPGSRPRSFRKTCSCLSRAFSTRSTSPPTGTSRTTGRCGATPSPRDPAHPAAAPTRTRVTSTATRSHRADRPRPGTGPATTTPRPSDNPPSCSGPSSPLLMPAS